MEGQRGRTMDLGSSGDELIGLEQKILDAVSVWDSAVFIHHKLVGLSDVRTGYGKFPLVGWPNCGWMAP